jgi:hypothetical protein
MTLPTDALIPARPRAIRARHERVRLKNMFGGPTTTFTPTPPTPAPPPPMPDPYSASAMEAKKLAAAKANVGGRSSTMLTQAAASTLAGGTYAGTKTGG